MKMIMNLIKEAHFGEYRASIDCMHTWLSKVSVTRQPLRERTLLSSALRRVEMAPTSRSSGTTAVASWAYSRSMLTPANFIFMTGTNESTTGCSSVTSGMSCKEAVAKMQENSRNCAM